MKVRMWVHESEINDDRSLSFDSGHPDIDRSDYEVVYFDQCHYYYLVEFDGDGSEGQPAEQLPRPIVPW